MVAKRHTQCRKESGGNWSVSYGVIDFWSCETPMKKAIIGVSPRNTDFRRQYIIIDPPKHTSKTPKSTFKFDLDLIFQGHLTNQSCKTVPFSKNLKNAFFSCYQSDYLFLDTPTSIDY